MVKILLHSGEIMAQKMSDGTIVGNGWVHRRISWSDVEPGQEVFLLGSHCGEPQIYGPHVVATKLTRTLRNYKGREFFHYAEDLLVKVCPFQEIKL